MCIGEDNAVCIHTYMPCARCRRERIERIFLPITQHIHVIASSMHTSYTTFMWTKYTRLMYVCTQHMISPTHVLVIHNTCICHTHVLVHNTYRTYIRHTQHMYLSYLKHVLVHNIFSSYTRHVFVIHSTCT